jgi:GTP cyclohydrolase I
MEDEIMEQPIFYKGAGVIDEENYDRVEKFNKIKTEKLTELYRSVLQQIEPEPEREGIKDTPLRVAKSMQFLTQGYNIDPKKLLESATFHENYQQMVLVKDIELYSLCEHHIIPFFGKAHVAYIPNGKITGLSKIARVVDAFSRRLQVQERLTMQIRDCIQESLNPLGVAVVIEAHHLCMMMRGVQKQNSVTTTSAFTGIFMKETKTREEFIHLIGTKLH